MSTHQQSDPAREWERWHEWRTAQVSAPHGPLSLTGTHWLSDHPDGRLPAVPGVWHDGGDAVLLTARPEDGVSLDGEPFTGEVRLAADRAPVPESRVAAGDRRLFVMHREGEWAVRDFDPDAPARRFFTGVQATPYDPRWVVPGAFRPYEENRAIRVENADGRVRGLHLSGELAFTLEGAEHTLQVVQEDDDSLWAVFADATSGHDSYRFRFLRPGPPAPDGGVTVDFNRALLPPCAFAAHFICPFPPPGNTLPVAVAAGERQVLAG